MARRQHVDARKICPSIKDAGVTAELVVKRGAVHGWQGMEKDVATFVDWFDRHLKKTN